ncbi:MAG TPA: 1-deoxy-D-xylulose-5-phosphate synthase [Clostridiales bacterium]|nr:1-deoxy-D-xylulose-5-phosphate synthase [Clostridiales bacterium]
MQRLLNKIKKENDIKKINKKNYSQLADEIREFLIENISKTGGHLASNLGVVELTIALHLYLDFPTDKLVWDVGHQAYVHKMLTGRKDQFDTLRQFEGLSGFPKVKESSCDSFNTGHSSTSISIAMGLVKARELSQENNKVIAVLGDGALTGGLAFEALNNAGRLKSNLIIILNDNNMSISENVGGMANYLAMLRTNNKYTNFKQNVENTLNKRIPSVGQGIIDKLKRSKDSIKHLMIKDMFFEDMGITYIGIMDGHNIEQLVRALTIAGKAKKAVVIHVVTRKGKGYSIAEKNPCNFHGIDAFDVDTGQVKTSSKTSYTKVFSKSLVNKASNNDKIVAITAAMPEGTGLIEFSKKYPKRFFDVGIAEAHAVTFAAGMASMGYKPVVAIYSTFLQRAYDQIIHDVCINNLPVIFAIDRAGIVGKDGETHQGIFDLSYLSHIPNLIVLAPKNKYELDQMLDFALQSNGPVAIRYPRGEAYDGFSDYNASLELGKSEILRKGKDIAIFALGSMVKTASKVVENLIESGLNPTLVNVRFVSPIDKELLKEIAENYDYIFTLEENVRTGGYGQQVSDYLCEKRFNEIVHVNHSIQNQFVEHGEPEELLRILELDADSITKKILKDMIK